MKKMSIQTRWDAHVTKKLEETNERIQSLDRQLAEVNVRIAGLRDSAHPSVAAVRALLELRKARLDARVGRQESIKNALENRFYSSLTVEQQGYVDTIGASTPDDVLRIGAQHNIDLAEYYVRGITASESISDVGAITQQDFIDIAIQIEEELRR